MGSAFLSTTDRTSVAALPWLPVVDAAPSGEQCEVVLEVRGGEHAADVLAAARAAGYEVTPVDRD